jgi:solute carrier family 8 (sodium/calcium exchanger)
LPLLPRTEESWPKGIAAVLYCLGLLYSFLAVSAIADIFMCAIEVITSQTKTVKVERNGNIEEVQVKVWNYTIANLSLMALGSSAPEILLSVIEIVGNDFKSGDLGPSTIVGSAAFNLLVITAICMMSIPHGESRRIKSIKVFGVTSFFSVFAYVWLYIVLQVSSSDEVELWEALITLFLFVALLLLAYVVDKEFCKKKIQPGGQPLM